MFRNINSKFSACFKALMCVTNNFSCTTYIQLLDTLYSSIFLVKMVGHCLNHVVVWDI